MFIINSLSVKMFIKESVLLTFIALFLQLWTTNKRKTLKNQKSHLSDFYYLCNTKSFGLQIRKCL